MDFASHPRAQQRADRIAAFRAELAELEREQALSLTAEQRTRLEAHLAGLLATLSREHGADVGDSAKRISWGMRVISLLGGVALFAAIVLFLHRFWGVMPLSLQAGFLTLLPPLVLAGAAVAKGRGVSPYYVGLLGVAAFVGFIVGLGAQGSIFNAVPSPHALLAWGAVGVLAGYALAQGLLLGAGLVFLCAYGGSLVVAMGGHYWLSFFEHAEGLLPGAATVYALPELFRPRRPRDFDSVYRFFGGAVGLVALLALSKSGDLCCAPAWGRPLEMLYQLAGLGLSAGIVWHGIRLGRSALVNQGAVGFSVFLLVRLHAWCWDWMPKYLFLLLVSLTAFGLLAAFRRLRRRLAQRGTA